MVKDRQVKILKKLIRTGKSIEAAAAKSGMSEKTARKWLRSGKNPSNCLVTHIWRTREDPFEEHWPWVKEQLTVNPGLEAKTLFEVLQRDYPGKYRDGQLRTLQRRVQQWRALEGPGKEIFFPQSYRPGEWGASDFTHMGALGITIAGQPFEHLVYHFVLAYSNWETGTICFSESYESLSKGFQDACWKMGGVPKYHRTDQLSSAVNKVGNPQEFTDNYRALANHYGVDPRKTQASCPHENGDVEQRHFRFKRAVDQALMLRGSRDFAGRSQYEAFLSSLFDRLNSGRQERFKEELKVLRPLPARRLEDFRRIPCRVGKSGLLRILHNSYSVHSRLRDQQVIARVYADHIEVWYAQRKVEQFERLRGENGYRVDYRHIIDQLIRKPGAFANCRYKACLFPTSQFRMAYDQFRDNLQPKAADKQYLKLLELAAKDGQTAVNEALRSLIHHGQVLTFEAVEAMVQSGQQPPPVTDVHVEDVDLCTYDRLLERQGVLI
jgi:transposase